MTTLTNNNLRALAAWLDENGMKYSITEFDGSECIRISFGGNTSNDISMRAAFDEHLKGHDEFAGRDGFVHSCITYHIYDAATHDAAFEAKKAEEERIAREQNEAMQAKLEAAYAEEQLSRKANRTEDTVTYSIEFIRDKINEVLELEGISKDLLVGNGAIYYRNGKNGTESDYHENGHASDFITYWKETELGCLDLRVYDDIIYINVFSTPTSMERDKTYKFESPFDLKELCEYLNGSFDRAEMWDAEIIDWNLGLREALSPVEYED